MLAKSKNTRMNDKGENYTDTERPKKGNILSNYRPITCLPTMRKILTAPKKGECQILFPEELKGIWNK